MLKENYRHDYASHKSDIRAAKELLYPKKVVRMIEDEKNPLERQRILRNARKGLYS